MRHDELKQVREQAGWTQAKMAKSLGLSANYYATMERGERPIERRTELKVDASARIRIDLSYSEALKKWVVAIITPGVTFAQREHHLIAAKGNKVEAYEIAKREWQLRGKLPMLIIRDPA